VAGSPVTPMLVVGQDHPAGVLGDLGAGDDVVTGDHPHLDMRGLRVGHRGLGFLPRRVDHADQAGHGEIRDVAEQIAVRVEGGRVQVAVGGGHHAEALALQPFHPGFRPVLQVLVPGHESPAGQRGRRPLEHRGGDALHVAAHDLRPGVVGHTVERGHQLVGGVERQGREPREQLTGGVDVHPGLGPEHQQGALGGVADDLAVLQFRVAGDQQRHDRVLDRGRRTTVCCTLPSRP